MSSAMKYTTKELLEMPNEKIETICKQRCDTKCPFKKSLRKYREEGFCIKRTYENVDRWIYDDKVEIYQLEDNIAVLKERIKRYETLKKLIKKELENE